MLGMGGSTSVFHVPLITVIFTQMCVIHKPSKKKISNPDVTLGRENHKGSLDMEFPFTSSLASEEPALFT